MEDFKLPFEKHFVQLLLHLERELVLELERIRKKNKSKSNEATSKIEDYMRTIEEERDYYKGEVEVLNRILKSRPESLRNSIREGSPLRSSKGKNRKPGSPSRSPAKLDKKVKFAFIICIHVCLF